MIESVAVHDRTLLFRSYFWLDFESHLADDPASSLSKMMTFPDQTEIIVSDRMEIDIPA